MKLATIVIWVASFLISAVIGARKGNPVGGAFLGLMLGPLGVIELGRQQWTP